MLAEEVKPYQRQINFIFTNGSRADCQEAIHLIKNINAKLVFADRAYDANEILSYLNKKNTKQAAQPKYNRLYQRDYKRKLYCFRHIIENTFLSLSCWCGISTRYAKTLDAFIASVFVRCIFILF